MKPKVEGNDTRRNLYNSRYQAETESNNSLILYTHTRSKQLISTEYHNVLKHALETDFQTILRHLPMKRK